MRLCVAWLNRDGMPQQRLRLLILTLANPVDEADRADDEAPGVDALGWLVRRPAAFLRVEVRLDRGDDVPCDFVLDGENVAQLSVVPLGPDVFAGRCVDQLPCNTDPSS